PQFTIQTGVCSLGTGEAGNWDAKRIHVVNSDGCSGCNIISGEPGDSPLVSYNPCNGCNGKLTFHKNGDWYNFYYEDGRQAGYCQPGTAFDACNQWNYSCSYASEHICEFWNQHNQAC